MVGVGVSAYHLHSLIARFIMLWRFVDVVTGFLSFILSLLCCSCLDFGLPGITDCDEEAAKDAKVEAGDCKCSANKLPDWMFEGNAAKLLESEKSASANTIVPVKYKRKCTLENEIHPSVHTYRKISVADASVISKHVIGV